MARDLVSEPTSSELFAYFEEMSLSAPLEAHWHLAFVGVDPFRIGEGIGSALLAHTLDRIDGEEGQRTVPAAEIGRRRLSTPR